MDLSKIYIRFNHGFSFIQIEENGLGRIENLLKIQKSFHRRQNIRHSQQARLSGPHDQTQGEHNILYTKVSSTIMSKASFASTNAKAL